MLSSCIPNSKSSHFHICMKIYFPLTVGCDMKTEIDMVKKKIYNVIVINKQETVYEKVNSTSVPSSNKAPPHCRKCHHPVSGHNGETIAHYSTLFRQFLQMSMFMAHSNPG